MSSPGSGDALLAPAVVGEYIALPVTVDPDQLMAEALAALSAKFPGWVPAEGHLEVALIEEFARMCAQTARLAASTSMAIFQYFGQSVLGLDPIVGAAPVTTVTWVAIDYIGHAIPKGTVLAFITAPGTQYLFSTSADVVIPYGQNTAAGVPIQCQQMTDAINGSPAAALMLVDNLSWTSTVTAESAPEGGATAETQAAYLARLRQELELLTPRPIMPRDFAAVARNQPGVARAVALDNYDPAAPAAVTPLSVTVCGIDSDGEALDAVTSAALQAAVSAQRSVNFSIHVMAPTYTTVNIAAQVVARPGYGQGAVSDAVRAALLDFLDPARWGGALDAGGAPTAAWTNAPTVRYLTVVGVIAAVPGVAYVNGVQLEPAGGTYTAGDVALPGAVPLTRPGTVSVNVSSF